MGKIRTAHTLTDRERTFLRLLHIGLWEEVSEDINLAGLTTDDWVFMFETSRRQTVRGLIWSAIQTLPDEVYPPQDVMWRWLSAIDTIERNNRRMTKAIEASRQLLFQTGTEPILMKGHAVAQLYAHPEWREAGDIDWYIPSQQAFRDAKTYLQAEALSPSSSADGSLFLNLQDVDVELHPQLVDIEAPQRQNRLRRLIEEEGWQQQSLEDGGHVMTPSPLLSLIMLNAHIMKHAFTVGVGLRQFCDMARAYHVWHKQYDAEKLIVCYEQLGLRDWSDLLHTILVTYLGLPTQELPGPFKVRKADARRLMRTVMAAGNFGQQTEAWQAASNHRAIKRHTLRRILGNMPLFLRYAPWEMTCKIIRLVIGQVNK